MHTHIHICFNSIFCCWIGDPNTVSSFSCSNEVSTKEVSRLQICQASLLFKMQTYSLAPGTNLLEIFTTDQVI